MSLPTNVLARLRCPDCGSPLEVCDGGLVCSASADHRFPIEDGIVRLVAPPAGKYDPAYAARYAALWAFGYETLHLGLDEPLYRAVSSLAAEALADHRRGSGRDVACIVDCGCGVGRVLCDVARLVPAAEVLAFDASPAMLALARRIALGTEPVTVSLPELGFDALVIAGRGLPNAHLLQADVEALPLADGVAEIALSVNIVDRLPQGPDLGLREIARILQPGGRMIFTNPLNWTEPGLWRRYPGRDDILRSIEELGFELETWFDDLFYREILDRRGSFEELKTLVVAAVKRPAAR